MDIGATARFITIPIGETSYSSNWFRPGWTWHEPPVTEIARARLLAWNKARARDRRKARNAARRQNRR